MAKLALNNGSEVDLHTALQIEQMCYAQGSIFISQSEIANHGRPIHPPNSDRESADP